MMLGANGRSARHMFGPIVVLATRKCARTLPGKSAAAMSPLLK